MTKENKTKTQGINRYYQQVRKSSFIGAIAITIFLTVPFFNAVFNTKAFSSINVFLTIILLILSLYMELIYSRKIKKVKNITNTDIVEASKCEVESKYRLRYVCLLALIVILASKIVKLLLLNIGIDEVLSRGIQSIMIGVSCASIYYYFSIYRGYKYVAQKSRFT